MPLVTPDMIEPMAKKYEKQAEERAKNTKEQTDKAAGKQESNQSAASGDRTSSATDRQYVERMEEEYAKREGGA